MRNFLQERLKLRVRWYTQTLLVLLFLVTALVILYLSSFLLLLLLISITPFSLSLNFPISYPVLRKVRPLLPAFPFSLFTLPLSLSLPFHLFPAASPTGFPPPFTCLFPTPPVRISSSHPLLPSLLLSRLYTPHPPPLAFLVVISVSFHPHPTPAHAPVLKEPAPRRLGKGEFC
jgi:hypothetical protein